MAYSLDKRVLYLERQREGMLVLKYMKRGCISSGASLPLVLYDSSRLSDMMDPPDPPGGSVYLLICHLYMHILKLSL